MYKIIIPSYKRKDIIKTHTINCLMKTDLKKEIYVFVANELEEKEYNESLKDYPFIKVVKGVRGIPNQRNFIQKYFKKNEHLLFIDDDIEKIIGLNKQGKRVTAIKMHDFIIDAFRITDGLKLKMFGINSTNSNLEMKNIISVGRIYLVGNFYGLINCDVFVDEGENIKKRLTFEAGKESHERALLMYEKFGGVVKFRQFGVVSKYWGMKGGHQVSRNITGEKQATIYLNEKYKSITSVRDYNGIPDLIIKAKTKVFQKKYEQ